MTEIQPVHFLTDSGKVGSLDQDDNLTRNKFDEGGSLRERIDANSNSVNYTYDLLGRQLTTSTPAGTNTTVYNNSTGRVDSRLDAKNNSTSYIYDILGRQETVTDRLGKNTVRTYNPAGQLHTITDAESKATTYTYDLLGRKLTTTYADAGVVSYDYDPAGSFPTGSQATKMTYDSGKSKTSIMSFDGTLDKIEYRSTAGTLTGTDDYTYDDQLRRDGSTSADGIVRALAYNDFNQLETDTTTFGGQSYVVTYGYDNQLRQDSITYPSGRVAAYTFTNRGELDTIAWNGSQIQDRLYDPAGRLTNIDRASTDEVRTYDTSNRLLTIQNPNVGDATYTWDANNNKLSETWTGAMASHSFTTEKPGASTFADGYDAEDRFRRFIQSGQSNDVYLARTDIGNINDVNINNLSHSRSFSDVHELTDVYGSAQTFDDDNNQLTTHDGVTLGWSDANRLNSTNNGTLSGSYLYDADNKRVNKKVVDNGTTTEDTVYIHAGPNCIAEYQLGVAATTPGNEYIYARDIDSIVMLAHNNNAELLDVFRGQRWSVNALADHLTGSVQERYIYDYFGNRTILEPNGISTRASSSYNMQYGYTSRRHDPQSGLMYFRTRFYEPTAGEFTSRDPLEYVDGMSLMRAYLGTSGTDPDGKCKVKLACTPLITVGGITSVTGQHCGVEVEHSNGDVFRWHVHSPHAGITAYEKYQEWKNGEVVPDTCDIRKTRIATPFYDFDTSKQPYSIEATWEDSTGMLCRCIDRKVRLINRMKLDYSPIPYDEIYRQGNTCKTKNYCNSNYVSSCMLHSCGARTAAIGITPNLPGPFSSGTIAPGWGHRMRTCDDWDLVKRKNIILPFVLIRRGCKCRCNRWKTIDSHWCNGHETSGHIHPKF